MSTIILIINTVCIWVTVVTRLSVWFNVALSPGPSLRGAGEREEPGDEAGFNV